MNNKTTVIAEPGSSILRIERRFNAVPEKVFRIFSERQFVEKWWNPFGGATVHALDFTEGGEWKFSTGGDEDITFHGFYHEITPPKRIVHTSEFDNLEQMIGDRGHTALSKYEFEPVDGGTKVILTELYMSVQDRDMAIENNMEQGVVASYESIDKLLEEVK
jgi:uncharacterized protein YndB with AHSA1/START domain